MENIKKIKSELMKTSDNIGISIANRVYGDLVKYSKVTGVEFEDAVYECLGSIVRESEVGDWVEFPGGSTAVFENMYSY